MSKINAFIISQVILIIILLLLLFGIFQLYIYTQSLTNELNDVVNYLTNLDKELINYDIKSNEMLKKLSLVKTVVKLITKFDNIFPF